MKTQLEVIVPGDKSVTHRGLLFGALASGITRVRKPLISEDIQSTASVLRHLGVGVPALDASGVSVPGVGLRGLREPTELLDCGNSGTTARLLLGILAGQPIRATLTGDTSLRGRPMARVSDPLEKMGARFDWTEQPGFFPATVTGGDLKSIDVSTPVASAQVKSAILLAGLTGGVFALVTEPRQSRDHTERLLAAMGAATVCHLAQGGWRVELRDPPATLEPVDFDVPADFSTAAFPLVWAVCRKTGPPLSLPGVGLNPTRTGFLEVLRRMGARIDVIADDHDGPEPTGTLIAYPSSLKGTEVAGPEIPAMIDEIPALVIAGLHADGETIITGASELRVKESDRIASLSNNLRALGIEVEEAEDGLRFSGQPGHLKGSVTPFDDHRIEMAFGVLEGLTDGQVRVTERTAAAVSYPAFWTELARLKGQDRADRSERRQNRLPLITIDGPAGSGKSTTAQAVARSLGLVHLDSGSLYRAVAYALLEGDVPEDEWPDLPTGYFSDLGISAKVQGRGIVLSLDGVAIADDLLRTPRVTAAVSRVAALPSVRAALIGLQREAARRGGLVADGRDMGTVVFPEADAKIFLVADLEERARRRVQESLGGDNEQAEGTPPVDEAEVVAMAQKIQARDFEDAHREHSPLRRPKDAIEIDTTALTPEEQLRRVLDQVRAVWNA